MTDATPQLSVDRYIAGRVAVSAGAVVAVTLAGAWFWKQQLPTPGEAVWFGTLVSQLVIRAPFAAQNAKVAVTKSHFDIAERLLLGFMFFAMMWLPLISIGTPLFRDFDYALPEAAVYVGAGAQLIF